MRPSESRLGDVSLTAQDLGQEVREVLLVLHDQYPHRHQAQSYPSTKQGARLPGIPLKILMAVKR